MSIDRGRTPPRHLRRRPARLRSRRMALLITLFAIVALGGGLLAAFSPLSSVATSAATRINAGGPAFTDSQGNMWKADNGYVGGQVYATTAAIARTINDALYQSERWGMSGYKVAVPAPDTYQVRLLLAEIWFKAPGQRVFDVSAEGTTYLRNVDIFAKVGRNRAYSPTFDVPVRDGVLDIGFRASVDLPKVSAIEVRRATGTTTTSTTASSTTTTTTTTRPPATTSSTSTTTAPQPAVQYGVDPNYQPTYDVSVPVGSLTQSLLDAHPEGTRFGIAAGTHRLSSVLHPRANQQLLGFPGAVLNGSKRLSSWTQDGTRWYAAGQTQRLPGMVKPPTDAPTCNPDSPLCDKSEDVFYDDTGLKQVTTVSELSAGRFYFDYANSRIYIADNPDGHKVETTVSNGLVTGGGADVVLKNLVLEKAGNAGNADAVGGSSWTIEHCEIGLNHGPGVVAHGSGTIMRANKIHRNGQIGAGGAADMNTIFERNELAYNNAQGFNMHYFAGGAKWALASGLTVRGNWIHHNVGPGIANDVSMINGLFEDNKVESNAGPGLQWEISYHAVFRDNRCGRNGLQETWALHRACILVYNSSNVEVYNNVLDGSGITLRQDGRLGPGRYGTWELANDYVHHNSLAYPSTVESGMVIDPSMDVNLYNTAKNNRFQSNTYDVPDPSSGHYWQWQNRNVSWAQWQAYGNDTAGTVR